MDRLEAHRHFFSDLLTATLGLAPGGSPLRDAFATTPRERFVGSGPWQVFTRAGYLETPSDDPALLYQDITIALKGGAQINNGQPSLHAACLSALRVAPGETVVHIGAGTGYYTSLLAKLTGGGGKVYAYEIDAELAQRARENLAPEGQVEVRAVSGSAGPLPDCDVIYVSAGATDPLDVWLDALRPGGRLLFPLTPAQTPGAMLRVTRTPGEVYEARFVCGAMFIPCIGARNEATAERLAAAFQRGDLAKVQSLRRRIPPDETSWCAGEGWWLSTAPAE